MSSPSSSPIGQSTPPSAFSLNQNNAQSSNLNGRILTKNPVISSALIMTSLVCLFGTRVVNAIAFPFGYEFGGQWSYIIDSVGVGAGVTALEIETEGGVKRILQEADSNMCAVGPYKMARDKIVQVKDGIFDKFVQKTMPSAKKAQ